jgi:hypothetical protein
MNPTPSQLNGLLMFLFCWSISYAITTKDVIQQMKDTNDNSTWSSSYFLSFQPWKESVESEITVEELVQSENFAVENNLSPYTEALSDFIVPDSTNQQLYRQKVVWFHAPKTSSTFCTTLHHLSCPQFDVPDDSKELIRRACTVPADGNFCGSEVLDAAAPVSQL